MLRIGEPDEESKNSPIVLPLYQVQDRAESSVAFDRVRTTCHSLCNDIGMRIDVSWTNAAMNTKKRRVGVGRQNMGQKRGGK